MAVFSLGERKVVFHGDEWFIAHNATVIGSVCLVGAGTLIPEGRTYPDGVLVLGSPGKVVRELKPEEKKELLEIADSYVRRSKLYREKLKPQER
jgi:carbonic anhydrase/acetyltransferase-like protein (isoleucine patch superfamily)